MDEGKTDAKADETEVDEVPPTARIPHVDGPDEGPDEAVGDTEAAPDAGSEAGQADETEAAPVTDAPEKDAKDELDAARAKHPHRGRRIGIAVAAVTAVLLAGSGAYAKTWERSQISELASKDAAIERDISTLVKKSSTETAYTADDLAADDSAYVDRLKDAVKAAQKAADAASPTVTDWYDVWDVSSNVDAAKDAVSGHRDALDSLAKVVKDVDESHERRLSDNARDALSKAIEGAQSLLDSTDGKVSDNATRDALSKALADASGKAKAAGQDPSVYSGSQDALKKATDAVTASNAAWKKDQEEAAARAAAARAAAARAAAARAAAARTRRTSSGGVSSGTYDGGTWNVSYRGLDDPTTANADGSTAKWVDGYYVAHSWSEGGKRIASKPQHVVDGKSYHYVSSEIISLDSDADSAISYAHQNGGIGFQTCVGNNNAIPTHYEAD
jgi:hypothetical protein